MSTAMQNLPPEMQQRLAQVMAQAQGTSMPESPHQAAMAQANGGINIQTQAQVQPQPPAKQPSLIEHVVALRHEVAALRQEQAAIAQVVDAVGQATGQIYGSLFNTGGADYGAPAAEGGPDF